MYRINLQELERTKNTYQEAAQKMQELGEAAGELSAQVPGDAWRGRDAEAFAGNMRGWLQHSHAQIAEKLAGVGRALSDAWETAADLKRHCESFAGIFAGDAATPVPGWEASGILSCDPQMTDRIAMHAREACENADRIKRLLDGMDREMAGMGGMGEIHACMEKIRADCNRIERLGDYAAAVETYREGVEQLDRSLAKALMPFSGSGAGECAGRYMPAGTEDGVNTQRLLWLLGQGDGILTAEEQEERDNALGLLAAGGDREALLAAAEAILEKEVSAWTEREASYAAWAWAYLVEEKDAEGVERFIRKLQHVEEATVGKPGQEVTVYVAYFGQEACSVLMENLDAATQGEAYYTLNRLGMYREVSVVPSMPKGIWQFRAGVRLEDGRLEIKLVTGTPGVADWKSTTFTVLDVGSEAGAEGRQVLGKLGFSKQQISALLLGAYTDADVKFVGALCRADSVEEYAELFLADPGELSRQMAAGLYGYACVLMENDLSEGSGGGRSAAGLGRLETFLNGMLASRRTEMEKREYRTEEGTEQRWEKEITCHTGEYLDMMAAQGEAMLDMVSACVYVNYNDKGEINRLIPIFNKQANMCALFAALGYLQKETEKNAVWANDAGFFRISGLKLEDRADGSLLWDGMSNAGFSFVQQEFPDLPEWMRPQAEKIVIDRVFPTEREGMERVAEHLQAEKDFIWSIPKAVGNVLGEFFWPVKAVMTAVEVMGDISLLGEAAEGITSAATDNKRIKGGVSKVSTAYGAIWDVYNSYCRIQETERAIFSDSMYDGIVLRQGSGVIVREGQYNINTVLRMAYFCHEGLSFMSSKDDTEERIEVALSRLDSGARNTLFKGLDEETIVDILAIVWQGKPVREECRLTIADLPPEQVRECMILLKNGDDNSNGWYAEFMAYDVLEEMEYDKRQENGDEQKNEKK